MAPWGALADGLSAQLHKGMLVYVEGRLRTRTSTRADNALEIRTEIHPERLMTLRSAMMRHAAYAAAEATGLRNGDEVPC